MTRSPAARGTPAPQAQGFRPHKAWFIVLLFVLVAWLGGLLAVHFVTVPRSSHVLTGVGAYEV